MILSKIFQSLDLHFERAQHAFQIIQENRLNMEVFFQDPKQIQTMDSFIY